MVSTANLHPYNTVLNGKAPADRVQNFKAMAEELQGGVDASDFYFGSDTEVKATYQDLLDKLSDGKQTVRRCRLTSG